MVAVKSPAASGYAPSRQVDLAATANAAPRRGATLGEDDVAPVRHVWRAGRQDESHAAPYRPPADIAQLAAEAEGAPAAEPAPGAFETARRAYQALPQSDGAARALGGAIDWRS